MYFSKTTGGFYDKAIHGSRTLTVIDPAWQRPTTQVLDPDWNSADYPAGTLHPLITVPDETAIAPTIEIPNPDCKIPADAVEITDAEHAALLEAQTVGKIIQADANGYPITVNPPPPTLDEVKASLTRAVQTRLDAVPAARGYDSAERCISYLGSTNPTFAAEAAAINTWRDAVWTHCIALLDQVTAGALPVPTEVELIAGLPAAPW